MTLMNHSYLLFLWRHEYEDGIQTKHASHMYMLQTVQLNQSRWPANQPEPQEAAGDYLHIYSPKDINKGYECACVYVCVCVCV